MMEFGKRIGSRQQTARKDHTCVYCGKEISKGQNYELMTVVIQNEDSRHFGRIRFHCRPHFPEGSCCELVHDLVYGLECGENAEFRDHVSNYIGAK